MSPNYLPQYVQLMDPASSTITYSGKAAAGSATSAPVWQISRLTFDGDGNFTSQTWASASGNFDQIWDNRASLSYS